MKRAAKIVAIVLGVLLAGTAFASAAAGNIASQASGEAEAEAEANASWGIDAVLKVLGFAETQAESTAEAAEETAAETESESESHLEEQFVSDVHIVAEGEAEVEEDVQAETPKAPEAPPKVEFYGQAQEVFKMTAMADQRVVIDYDAGVVGHLEDQTSATLEGPGYTGNLNLRAVGDAYGGSNGHIEVSTHKAVVVMEKGEQLVMSTESEYDRSYELATDAYGEIRDQAHVQVDETVRAYMGLKAEAQANAWSKAKWTAEKADFHEEVLAQLQGQVDATTDMVLHSAGEAEGESEGSASGSGSATAVAESAGSAGGDATPPVCDL